MTPAPKGKRLLGIDWGTSNRRAYLVAGGGACLATRADDQGMLAAGPGFGKSLAGLLAAMQVGPEVPVLASGMIGSAQGWHETPYLDVAVPLTALPEHLVRATDPAAGRDCLIVPGYSQHRMDGQVDVMRGEETQLLGALALARADGADGAAGDGWYVLPGTHSKWVRIADGVIRHMSTFMTGELFSTLGKLGTLAPLMHGPDDEQAFAAGVDLARRRLPLSQALFGVRARVVTGAMPAAHTRSCVSGLLIGAELVAALDLTRGAPGTVASIAAPALHERYASAAARLGLVLRALEPDRVYLAALGHFLERIG